MLLGKGVCFDTGGVQVKPHQAMTTMKKDMGGAAHMLALAQLVMQAKLPVALELWIATCDNGIDGNAFRPGDVFVARDGTSVEIGHTDAEGRLLLADLLAATTEKAADLVEPINALWNVFDGARPDIKPKDPDGDFWTKEQVDLKDIWQLHLTGLSYQPWHPRYNTHLKATHWRQDLMEVWWDYAKIVSNINKPHEV